MTAKYHTADNGKRALCHAEVRGCPKTGGHVTRGEAIWENQKNEPGLNPFNDVRNQLDDPHQSHYRIYLDEETNKPVALHLSAMDYFDKDPSRFLNKEAYIHGLSAVDAADDFNDVAEEIPHGKSLAEPAPAGTVLKITGAEKAYMDRVNDKSKESAHTEVLDQLESYDAVHYRAYYSKKKQKAVTVCVQNHDYYDYDDSGFVEKIAHKSEEDAERAVQKLNGTNVEIPVEKTAGELYNERLNDPQRESAFNEVQDQLKSYDAVHYRTYFSKKDDKAISICVQSFDYYDYDDKRFLGKKAYDDEEQAEIAARLMNA